ncbi:MAG: protein kinase [Limisphaerales bacterium]
MEPSPDAESALPSQALASQPQIPGSRLRPLVFGDYELLDEIARGGMGIVFRARQISLNRIVAVKMIRAGVLASELDISRFRAEAQAAARIQHPNIIPIYEVGEYDERHYFSMAFVAGQNLAQCVHDRPWSPPKAARCLALIAEAVQYAHDGGILHRDLKPSNVIIDEDGIPHLTDFGLATRIEDTSALTCSGAILGTPSYMAPEQTGGRRSELGPRTDIYALGALLYEVLTGHPPFQGESPIDTIKLVREADPVPPRRLNPRIPADIETIALKCLEKEPRKRYATARELAADLNRFLARQPILARPTRSWEIGFKWICRNPWRAALAASISIGFIATSAFLLEMAANRQLRENDQKLRKSVREQASRAEYRSRLAEAQEAIAANGFGEAEHLLELCLEEFRGWEWHYLRKLISPEHARYRLSTEPIRHIGLSSGANRAAALDDNGQLRSVDLASGSITEWFEVLPPDVKRLSPTAFAVESGRSRAIVGSGSYSVGVLKTLSAQSPTELPHFGNFSSFPLNLVLSADDTLLVSVGADGLTAWDMRTGSRLWTVNPPPNVDGLTAAISGDGGTIAWILQRPEPRKRVATRPSGRGEVVSIHRSPDGSMTREIRVAISEVRAITLSRLGDRLATGHDDGRLRVWDLATGQLQRTLSGHLGPVIHLAFSADDSQLVSGGADREVRLWSLDVEGESSVFRGNRADIRQVGISPDQETVISVSEDAWVRQWSVRAPRSHVESAVKASSLDFLDDHHIVVSDGKVYSAIDGSKALTVGPPSEFGRVQSAPGSGWCLINGDPFHFVEVPTLTASAKPEFKVHRSPWPFLTATAIDALGKHVAFTEDWETLSIRSLDNGLRVKELRFAEPGSRRRPIYDIRFSRDGSRILFTRGPWAPDKATDQTAGELQIWDWRAGLLMSRIPVGRFPIWTVLFHPDDQRIVTAGGFAGTSHEQLNAPGPHGEIVLWDIVSGCELTSLPGVVDNVFGIAISPDGTRLAAALGKRSSQSPGQVKLWDLETGDELLTFRGFAGPVHGVAFSPNGKRLACVGPSGLRIWSIE